MARAARGSRREKGGATGKKNQDDSADEAEQLPTATPSPDDKEDGPKEKLIKEQQEIIEKTKPKTKLEKALTAQLERTDGHIERLTGEIQKLKEFLSKRKQTYKRKHKNVGAPKRPLSAYNVYVQEKFKELANENKQALQSADSDAQLQRVPPADLVAATGGAWKNLPAQEKQRYEEIAKADRKRYEEQMATYKPSAEDAHKVGHGKRQKTGYNKFFSAHVLRLKQTDTGVPSERGAVARIVGAAWKQLSAEEKEQYERQDEVNEPDHLVKNLPESSYPPHYGGGRGGPPPQQQRYSPPSGQRGPPPPPHMMYPPPPYHGGGGGPPPPQGGYYPYPPGGGGQWGSPAPHHQAYYQHRGPHPPSQSFEGPPEEGGRPPPPHEGRSPQSGGGDKFYEI